MKTNRPPHTLSHLGSPTKISPISIEEARVREQNGECNIIMHHDGNFSVHDVTDADTVNRLKAIRNAPTLDWGLAIPSAEDFDAADKILEEYGRIHGIELKISRARGVSRTIICDGVEHYSYNRIPATII